MTEEAPRQEMRCWKHVAGCCGCTGMSCKSLSLILPGSVMHLQGQRFSTNIDQSVFLGRLPNRRVKGEKQESERTASSYLKQNLSANN